MHKYLRDLVSEHKTGLATIQVPTGAGKSYEIAKLIKEMADDPNEQRKIIYLTSLKKNLPDKDIEAMYGEDEEGFRSKILRIRANTDEIKEKLLNMEIPERFKTDAYVKLCNEIKKYNQSLDSSNKAFLQDILENCVSEAEKTFRKEIEKTLQKNFKNKPQRLKAILTNPEYKWIGELYPAVFTDGRQVLVMSISKFIKHNSTLIDRSYEFLKAKYLENAVIFIDEFDSTKNAIIQDIISNAASIINDYINLFRQIKRSLVMEDMSRPMWDAAHDVKGKHTLESIIEEADNVWEDFYLGLSYKVSETSKDHTQNFLVKDGTFHSIFQDDKYYIKAVFDPQENRILITFENGDEYYKEKEKQPPKDKDDSINIYSALRSIGAFITHFRSFVYLWGDEYAKIINEQRKQADNLSDELSEGSAVSSIMAKLGLSREQQQIIIGELYGTKIKNKKNEVIPDLSFYQKGVEIFSFLDHDDHNDYTELAYTQIINTPEKILAYLAGKALVLGVSATAELESVISNYDLGYLRNTLGDHYYPMDKDVAKRVGDELEKKWAAYYDGRITVHAETIKDIKGNFDLDEVCENIFENKELGRIVADQIRQKNDNEYYQIRYCNILKTMHMFMEKQDIKSMLYLGMALPKINSTEMSEELLRKFGEYILQDLGIEETENFIYILRSENFDKDKEKLLKRLEDGEKIYVLSTYQTIGAGQNMQYGVKDKSNYVELVPYTGNGDKRHFTKDFDAIYLGNITNKTINTYSEKGITFKESLDLIIQIEEVYSAGEINYKQKGYALKVAFEARRGKTNINPLAKTRSVNLTSTGSVLQAVGRLCRTHIKSPNIYVWIDEELVDILDMVELNSRILPPEMKAIVSLKKTLGREYTDKETIILNTAERISTDGNVYIRQQLYNDWTDNSMELWSELRNVAMCHPTASEQLWNDNTTIKRLYVASGSPINKYLYSQSSDFSDTTIDFGMDAITFKNSGRAKKRRPRDSEFIISTVSSEDAKLDSILKYPGMEEHFKTMGYATEFEPNDYIMSPVIFHNIYKGALGEVAGAYILKKERGIELNEIKDASRFEFFDFEMAPDVYVDFKNWKYTFTQDRTKTLEEITKKMNAIKAKRVYIINIVSDEKIFATTTIDRRIIEIPALIDGNGHIIHGMLDKIIEEDYIK